MDVLTKTELAIRYEEVLNKLDQGSLFIHPTDTIYGLGCNAQNETAVNRLRKLKDHNNAPFSVWAPSVEWIKQNCVINSEAESWLKKLPGSYTLILRLKNKKAIAKSVNLGKETLGVRIPNHWFNKVVETFNVPIITTSVNKSGQSFMTKLENLDDRLKINVDYVVYEGEKDAQPSKIVDLSQIK